MIQKSISLMGLASLIIFLFSCEKELKCENTIQLTDERTSFLVDDWQWEYTTRRTYDKATGNVTEDTIFAHEKNEKYTIHFEQQGKVEIAIDEKLQEAYCIVDSVNINTYYPNKIDMRFTVSDKEDQVSYLTYRHTLNSSIMRFGIKEVNFPYSYEENIDEQIFYGNYFQKQ